MPRPHSYRFRASPSIDLDEPRPIPASAARLDWHRGFLAAHLLLIVLGLWLMASSFVLDYEGREWWIPLLAGGVVVIVSLLALLDLIPAGRAAGAEAAVGAALLLAGMFIDGLGEPQWSVVAAGALTALLALVAASAAPEAQPG